MIKSNTDTLQMLRFVTPSFIYQANTAALPLIYSTMISDHNSLVCLNVVSQKGVFLHWQSTGFSHRNLPLDQGIIVRNQCTRCNKVLYHYYFPSIYPSLIIMQSIVLLLPHISIFFWRERARNTQQCILDRDLCSSRFVGIGNYPRWSLRAPETSFYFLPSFLLPSCCI